MRWLWLAASASSACGAGMQMPASTAPVVVRMERGGLCLELAHCPGYVVTLYRDGVVEYDGKRGVATTGRRTARVELARLADLEAELDRTELRSYPERDWTDHAEVTLTLRGSTLRHYLGDCDAPLALSILENRIDVVADSARWTGLTGPFLGCSAESAEADGE